MGHPRFWCGSGGAVVFRRDGFVATEGADGGTMAIGLFGADAGDGEEFGDGGGAGLDEGGEDGVGEDDEGGFSGLGGFGFAPGAEAGFEGLLGGGRLRRFAREWRGGRLSRSGRMRLADALRLLASFDSVAVASRIWRSYVWRLPVVVASRPSWVRAAFL